MTDTERRALWGSAKAPKSIAIPDDPGGAATKLWLWWGATPSKLRRLVYELGRRTKCAAAPRKPTLSRPDDKDMF